MAHPPRRLTRVVKGLAALASLVIAVAGVPIALWKLGGNPVASIPDLDAWTSRDDGTVLIAVLTWAGWLGWASFALSIVTETATALFQVRIRIPGLGAQQRVAAALVAAIAAIVISPSVASANASVVDTARQPTHAAMVTGQPAALAHATTANQAPTTTVVTLITQQKGSQQLRYVVAKGDWLSYIAQRFGVTYQEIAELNPQYAGRTDATGSRQFPDHIEATWRLKLPTHAKDRGPIKHATGEVLTRKPAKTTDDAAPDKHEPAPVVQPTPAPTATVAADDTPPPTLAPTPQPTDTQATAPQRTVQDISDEDAFNTPLAVTASLAGAGVLAGLTLILLRRRRSRAQQHRPAGRRLVTPDPAIEVATRHAAKPDVDRLDQVLRHLGAALEGNRTADLPDVAAAWIDGGEVALILAQDCSSTPPEPFTAAGQSAWIAPSTAPVPTHVDQPCPVPGLLTISSKPGGGDLLIDAERTSLLTIVGDPARSADLLRYLAAEAATCTWADDASITLAGFDPQTTSHLISLNEHRVRATNDVHGAIEKITRRAAASHAALAASQSPDTLTARVNDVHGDVWPLQMLILADPDGQYTGEFAALDEHLRQYPRTGVVVIATSSTATTWSVDVDADGTLAVDWLGTQSGSPATQLTATELADLATMVRDTRPSPAILPTTPFDEEIPAAADGPPWAAGINSHGSLLDTLFGQDDPDQEEPAHDVDPQAVKAAADQADRPEHDIAAEPEDDEPETEDSTAPLATAEAAGNSEPIIAVPAPWQKTATQRALADPDLDTDFAEWHSAEVIRPRIAILGPVHLEAPGQQPEERLPFYTELAVFLAQRGTRGATTDEIIANLWADRGLGANVVRVYIAKVRKWLGEDPTGEPWLPPNLAGGAYLIRPGYLSDWDLFRRRRARGESRGPAGTADLRAALELVRGAPLDGADRAFGRPRNPYAWLPDSSISPYHLTAAIVDTAHTLVELYLAAGDTEGARWAVNRAWAADPDRTDDHPWRDLIRIAHAEGHDSEVRAVVEDLMSVRNAEVPEELSTPTCNLVYELLGDRLARA